MSKAKLKNGVDEILQIDVKTGTGIKKGKARFKLWM
jgi:hypothetical protein